MSEKTYITPLAKEPEFVIVPMGTFNELGVKLKRKAIKFYPNVRGVGQFTTSDPKLQAFLDNHEWMKLKKLVCMGESKMVPPSEPIEPEQKQTVGPVTSAPSVPVKKGRPSKK